MGSQIFEEDFSAGTNVARQDTASFSSGGESGSSTGRPTSARNRRTQRQLRFAVAILADLQSLLHDCAPDWYTEEHKARLGSVLHLYRARHARARAQAN